MDVWSAYGMGLRTSGPQQYWQVPDCHVRLPPADLRRLASVSRSRRSLFPR